jgi:hypothetical protein
MNGKACHIETDPMLSRLSVLPSRLRIAHLAALLRCGRLIVRDGSLSYPSPHERERAVGREGRSEAEARVGGAPDFPRSLHPDARLWLASTLPAAARGEESTASTSIRGGRAG